MAESRDMRKQIEHLVERSQHEIVEASRNLSNNISKGTERLVTPISDDIERIVDDVFDFAERVVNSQRRMVSDLVKTINEQADRAADVGRTATRRITKRAPAKKAAAKRAPAKRQRRSGHRAKKSAAKAAPARSQRRSGLPPGRSSSDCLRVEGIGGSGHSKRVPGTRCDDPLVGTARRLCRDPPLRRPVRVRRTLWQASARDGMDAGQ